MAARNSSAFGVALLLGDGGLVELCDRPRPGRGLGSVMAVAVGPGGCQSWYRVWSVGVPRVRVRARSLVHPAVVQGWIVRRVFRGLG